MTVKEARKQLNLTQKQVADCLRIPIKTIQSWEQGTRTNTPQWVTDLVVAEIFRRFSK